MPLDFCTNENRFLSIRQSGTSENKKYELISYDTDDGSVSQTFTLNFIPRVGTNGSIIRDCNDNYLAIMDVLGNVHIYKYSHPQPDPFPVWVIILIVVGSLLIVGGIVGYIFYRRRQGRRQGLY